LTGWAGGGKAQRLSDEMDDEILEKALLSLANIFNLPVNDIREKLSATKVFNWQKNEWSLGAYSYSMPESVAARKLLNTPVNNAIYFSGEALYEGESPGTVEAAIVHSKQTAAKLLKEK
jgi:monoamine oxidase